MFSNNCNVFRSCTDFSLLSTKGSLPPLPGLVGTSNTAAASIGTAGASSTSGM